MPQSLNASLRIGVWSSILWSCGGGANGQQVLRTLEGQQSGDLLGRSVSSVDLDLDGHSDLIVSARADAGSAQPGHVFAYSGADGSLLYQFDGESSTDRFGVVTAEAGDVDADLHPDLLVGAWKYSTDAGGGLNNAGKAYCYSGATGDLLWAWTGAAGDNLGHALSTAGDIDHDGHDDVAIGAWGHAAPLPNTGACYVYSGCDGSLLASLFGEKEGDDFGKAVSSAGDFDSDGTPDLLIGAWFHDSKLAESGRAYVYSGADWSVLLILDGSGLFESFGAIVAGAEDVNGDGVADFMVGGVLGGPTGSGRVCLYSGGTGALLHEWTGEAPVDYFGSSLTFCGDVDRDGIDDVLIGATGFLKPDVAPGWAYVYSGRTRRFLHRFNGEAMGDRMGIASSKAADVNADGCDDVFVGAYLNDHAAPEAGRAYVFAGNDLFLSGPDTVQAGTPMYLKTSGGEPNAPVLTFIWSVNSSPYVMFLNTGVFDSQGQRTLTFNTPPGIAGLTIGFKTFSRTFLWPSDSNEWVIQFQ